MKFLGGLSDLKYYGNVYMGVLLIYGSIKHKKI